MERKSLCKVFSLLMLLTGGLGAAPVCSVKAMGMAGASVACGQDSLTTFYNPATAASLENRNDFGLSTQWTYGTLDLHNRPIVVPPLQSGRFKTHSVWDPYVDVGINYRFGCADQCAVGLQWNNYDQIHTRYHVALTDFSGTGPLVHKAQFNYRVDVLSLTGAWNFHPCHAAGVSLNVYFSWLKVAGLEFLTANGLSIDPAAVTDNGTDYGTGIGVTFGWQGKFLCDQLAIGAAFSPRVHVDKFQDYKGLLPSHSLDIPETARVGIAYQLTSCSVLAVDYEWRRYSNVESWADPFSQPDPVLFAPPFGAEQGPGFGWRNQWAVKVGLEYAVACNLNLRVGYRHERSPIPANTTDTALNALTLNTVQEYLSTGFTWKYNPWTEFSAFAEYGFRHAVDGRFPEIAGGDIWSSANTTYARTCFRMGAAVGRGF